MANWVVDSDLVSLLQECEVPHNIIQFMQDHFEVRCVRHLAHWRSHIDQVEEMINSKIHGNPGQVVLSHFRAAWKAANRKNEFNEGSRALAREEADTMAPLDSGTRTALLSAWRAQPIFDIPSTWQAPEGVVGACFRALERRCITAEPVRGLGNVDSASAFQPKPNSFDLVNVTVTAKDGSRKPVDPWKAEFRTDAPWTYLQGLKLLLLAIAKAGALAMKPARIHSAVFPTRLNCEHKGPNVYVQDVIDYLAKLENFVITYSRRNPQPSASEDLADVA